MIFRIHHYLLYNTRVQNDDWGLALQIVFRDLCAGSLSVVPKLAILIDVQTNTTYIHTLAHCDVCVQYLYQVTWGDCLGGISTVPVLEFLVMTDHRCFSFDLGTTQGIF